RVEALRRLLDRLVERLRRRMAVLAQHLILGQPQAVDRAHEYAALAGQVAEDLILEGRLEQVARANGNAGRQAAVAGPAGGILVDGKASVDAPAFEEQPADRRAGALRRDEDHVDVLRRHHTGLVGIDDRETVREVERLAPGEMRLDGRPLLLL